MDMSTGLKSSGGEYSLERKYFTEDWFVSRCLRVKVISENGQEKD